MTNSSPRESAKSLHAWATDPKATGLYAGTKALAEQVAAAWLAEHPEDDDVAIDEVFATNAGFQWRDSHGRYQSLVCKSSMVTQPRKLQKSFVFILEFAPSLNGEAALSILDNNGGRLHVQCPATRGDLRRLAAALNIELRNQQG